MSSEGFTYSATKSTYSAGVDYKQNRDVLVYAKYSTGFARNRARGSPAFPAPVETLRRIAALAADRAYYPPGAGRQLAAGRGAPDRKLNLCRLSLPTLVIHGSVDPLILPVCGQDTADNVPSAWFLRINGMGHDLPEPLFDLVVANIVANCARADPGLAPPWSQIEPHGAG